MQRTTTAVLVTVLLVAGSVGGVLALAPGAAPIADQQEQTTCDYQSLFDETIDSVVSVLEDGPSADALQGATEVETVGDRPVPVGGDVILAIDGQQLGSGEALGTYLLTGTEPGDTVDLTVIRDGEVRQVQVTVGERPDPMGT